MEYPTTQQELNCARIIFNCLKSKYVIIQKTK